MCYVPFAFTLWQNWLRSQLRICKVGNDKTCVGQSIVGIVSSLLGLGFRRHSVKSLELSICPSHPILWRPLGMPSPLPHPSVTHTVISVLWWVCSGVELPVLVCCWTQLHRGKPRSLSLWLASHWASSVVYNQNESVLNKIKCFKTVPLEESEFSVMPTHTYWSDYISSLTFLEGGNNKETKD